MFDPETMNVSFLFTAMIFGVVGLGYFVYGRKQHQIVPLLSGISLNLIPFFLTNIYLLVTAGIILAVLPYFIRF